MGVRIALRERWRESGGGWKKKREKCLVGSSERGLIGKTQCIFLKIFYYLKITRMFYFNKLKLVNFSKISQFFSKNLIKNKIARKIFFHFHGSEICKFCILSHFHNALDRANFSRLSLNFKAVIINAKK